MTTLPPLFYTEGIAKIDFTIGEGLVQETRYHLPGHWHDLQRHDAYPAILPLVTQVVDNLFGLADPSTGVWRVDVVPITTPNGAAAADAMGPAFIEFEAAATTLEDTVLALIAAADTGAGLTVPSDAEAWNRFRSYVELTVGGTVATLRATAVTAGSEFSILVTPPVGNSTTPTTVASPSTTVIRVGLYYAIAGRTDLGQIELEEIGPATDPANFVGPILYGTGTQPVTPGYQFYVYDQGDDVSVTRYGVPLAYGEAPVAAAAVDGPVYIRHTVEPGGQLIPGLVASAAVAEAAATAAVITATPAPLDATLYAMSVTVDGVLLGTLEYTSGAGATAVEIADGYRAALALNPTISALITADAAGASPVIFTGPADGRTATMADVGVGVSGIVNAPAVSFHTRHLRDTFKAVTTRIGSAPVTVPHP